MGEIESIRFKARLVARGFTQEEGVDYNDVFSPVVKHSSIRILLAFVAKYDWELHQLDVKTTFLHGELEETIYMHQPEGFIEAGNEQKVCLLKRSLYGLKQSSRQWYLKFDEHMMAIGFRKSQYDSCVYIKERKIVPSAFLLLYVDDMLVAGADLGVIQGIKAELESKFEMKNLGNARRILGMDIIRDRSKRELRLVQKDYIQKILKRFQADGFKPVSTPLAGHFKLSMDQRPKDDSEREELSKIPYANIIGRIMYTMLCTRPDLAHAISVTSCFMSDHGREHWIALKWLLIYLKGAAGYGLMYKAGAENQGGALVGFCDSDYASNRANRRSQTGYVFNLYGIAISRKSGLQHVVALSTTEAEYIAMTEVVKEAMWLKGILEDFGEKQDTVYINCDSSSALCLANTKYFMKGAST